MKNPPFKSHIFINNKIHLTHIKCVNILHKNDCLNNILQKKYISKLS